MSQAHHQADAANEVIEWRKEKDAFMATNPQSPLPAGQRDAFTGLPYFPFDPSWSVAGTARRVQGGPVIKMNVSRSAEPQDYIQYARARLAFPDGKIQELTLYTAPHEHHGHEPHEPHQLFLPIRDATSGKTTYGAGRYLEVVNPLGVGQSEAPIRIDFNMLYSPFCAYNEGYVCPLPPQENWVDSAIEAGEQHKEPSSSTGA